MCYNYLMEKKPQSAKVKKETAKKLQKQVKTDKSVSIPTPFLPSYPTL